MFLLEANLKSTGRFPVELALDVTCGRVLTLVRPAARTMISGAEVSLSKVDTKLLSDFSSGECDGGASLARNDAGFHDRE